MKVVLAIGLLLVFLLPCVVQAESRDKDPIQRSIYGSAWDVNEFTGAQSQAEIVAGVTGATLVIDSLIFAVSAACNLYISDGTTVELGKIYAAANSTVYMPNLNIELSSGGGIDVTTSLAGNHTVCVEYHQEP